MRRFHTKKFDQLPTDQALVFSWSVLQRLWISLLIFYKVKDIHHWWLSSAIPAINRPDRPVPSPQMPLCRPDPTASPHLLLDLANSDRKIGQARISHPPHEYLEIRYGFLAIHIAQFVLSWQWTTVHSCHNPITSHHKWCENQFHSCTLNTWLQNVQLKICNHFLIITKEVSGHRSQVIVSYFTPSTLECAK